MTGAVVDLVAQTEGEIGDGLARTFIGNVPGLVSASDWAVSPPSGFDEADDAGRRIVGVVHHLTSVANDFDADVDRRQLSEVRSILSWLAAQSASLDLTLTVYYGGETVGWIENGALDDSITVGLLEEWQRHIDGSS